MTREIAGHRFTNPELLTTALTHRSVGHRNNERLEFLGDALLGVIIAEELYRRYPEADEGQLTRMRASLVKKESLADIARALEIGPLLVLGEGELKSGGWRRDSILANALEAIIGAVYIDSNMDVCREILLGIYSDLLKSASPETAVKDAKTKLQEYLQSRNRNLPLYEIIDREGEQHKQTFTIRCTVDKYQQEITARGSSRRRAEQSAAARMLEELQQETGDQSL